MTILTLQNIEKAYGAESILERVNLQLAAGVKAALIGANGSGKTTLLKIITGELAPDGGLVSVQRGARCGYLPQQPSVNGAGSLRGHLEQSLRLLLEMKRQISSLEKEISAFTAQQNPRLEALLNSYGELVSRFREQGGYEIESRIIAVARGLGFKPCDLERDLSSFSGGEKTRARLAALLLEEPDLLLLDEPTNYLDLEGLEWLERYLRDWPGSLLLVSHDRFFMDRVVKRIFLLEHKTISCYDGNYSVCQEQRRQEALTRQRSYNKRQELLEREEKLIREAKADRRSKRQASSRQKRLAKLAPLEELPEEQNHFRLGFGYAGRSGRLVVSFQNVAKSFPARELFEGLSFELFWGDRVALVGPNGAGKSTILKLISGEALPAAGEIRLGPAVEVAYFSQEQEQLAPEQSLLEEIVNHSGLDLKAARNHLGRYLFKGDDVYKKVKELSGGEKSRLALARLALVEGNCLLMDEPTSHLDLPALEDLEQALSSYPGTLIVVSHDRYFLNKLVNRVLELSGGKLRSFRGSFQEYLAERERVAARPDAGQADEAESQRKLLKQPAAARQEEIKRQREQRQLTKEQQELEKLIAGNEAAIAALEASLSDPALYGNFLKIQELSSQLQREQSETVSLLGRWEQVSNRLEALKDSTEKQSANK